MAHVVLIGAPAGLIAVLAPVSLRTQLLAPAAGVAGPALAPAVHRVAGGLVVAVALVGAVGPEGAPGTRLAAVSPHPAAGTATLASRVEALARVLTRATSKAPAKHFNNQAGVKEPSLSTWLKKNQHALRSVLKW